MTRVGGQSPDSYGLSTTVIVTAATASAPVKTNQPLVWGTTAHSAVIAAVDQAFDLVAKHPVEDALTPLGVWVCGGKSRIHVFSYTGADPVVGDSIVADGAGGVKKAATANDTKVLFVDTARKYVEALI